ncbi:MAG: hypothetical protein KF767_16355 [Bdellovibrionaceae bacterium]|nr:hypothetical protein [Pseudobdellovibrionaceae bacterium]
MNRWSRLLVLACGFNLAACAGGGEGGGAAAGVKPSHQGWTAEEHRDGLGLKGVTRAELYFRLVGKARAPGFEAWVREFDRHLDLRCEKTCEVSEHNTLKREN